MKRSESHVLEIFYRSRDGEPLTIYPRFCFDDGVIRPTSIPWLTDGVRLDDFMKTDPSATVCFCRTYGLGDILVLTPIFSSLKERYPESKVVFATADGFVPLFKYWDWVKSVRRVDLPFQSYGIGYYLDGVVEKDHEGGRYSYMHRLDINCDFIGWPVPKDPVFSLPYSDVEKKWAETVVASARQGGKAVVVMQLSGAMWFNRFPLAKTAKIAGELSRTCSVILIHNFKQSVDLDGVTNLTGLTTVHELTALIDAADVAVTMDSGALWVAHCTKTPVVAIFGHTRTKEKMAHHRNYYAIDLAGMVGCESCFGRRTKCKGTADCLGKSDTGKIVEQIQEGIKRLVSGGDRD
jgi:ADP-heptose:LPS heptosyltransferase